MPACAPPRGSSNTCGSAAASLRTVPRLPSTTVSATPTASAQVIFSESSGQPTELRSTAMTPRATSSTGTASRTGVTAVSQRRAATVSGSTCSPDLRRRRRLFQT